MKADDYEQAILKICTHYLERKVKVPGETTPDRYLLQVKRVAPTDEEGFFGGSSGSESGHFISIKLTNASLFYQIYLFKEQLDKHRTEVGIQGDWTSFFEVMENALETNSKKKRKDDQFPKVQIGDDEVQLTLRYRVTSSFHVDGSFTLQRKPRKLAAKAVQSLLFELVAERDGSDSKKGKEEELKEEQKDGGRVLEADIEDLKKLAAQKKKFKAGLVNPNARKKKGKGLVFKN